MKLVRVVSELDFGGLEKVVELVSLELNQRAGIELWVIVLSTGGSTSSLLSSQGINVMVLDQKSRIPNFLLLSKLIGLFKKLKPDILHTSGAEANFHGLIAGFFAGIRVRIAEEIGFPNHHFLWELLFKVTYLFSHKVIVISKAVQEFIVDKREVPLGKTQIIYNPVRVFAVPSNHVKGEKFMFITVARLVPIKNIEWLLVAFEQVENPNKSLVIIGDGSSKDSLYHLAISLGISSQVEFLGFQSDVRQFLVQAHCFVLPSFSEGSSVALAEAMMAELPSIVTTIGGASEILGDSKSGILIDPYDPLDLKNAMNYMFSLGHEERREMGKHAREYVVGKFSPSTHVDQLKALYGEVYHGKD